MSSKVSIFVTEKWLDRWEVDHYFYYFSARKASGQVAGIIIPFCLQGLKLHSKISDLVDCNQCRSEAYTARANLLRWGLLPSSSVLTFATI
jgi:hypothetical protein